MAARLPDSARFPPVRSRLFRLSEVAGTPKLARRALCAAEKTEGRCKLKNYPESWLTESGVEATSNKRKLKMSSGFLAWESALP